MKKRKNIALIIFCIPVIIYTLFFFLVSGDSMEPAYHDGQIVLVNRFVDAYHRGDVIIFKTENTGLFSLRQKLIKRIVGVPGDTVWVSNGVLYINDIPYDLTTELINDAGAAEEPVTLSDNEYFVLGDNVNNSKDSRVLGPVNGRDVIGCVLTK